jgi:hypothetical protein
MLFSCQKEPHSFVEMDCAPNDYTNVENLVTTSESVEHPRELLLWEPKYEQEASSNVECSSFHIRTSMSLCVNISLVSIRKN